MHMEQEIQKIWDIAFNPTCESMRRLIKATVPYVLHFTNQWKLIIEKFIRKKCKMLYFIKLHNNKIVNYSTDAHPALRLIIRGLIVIAVLGLIVCINVLINPLPVMGDPGKVWGGATLLSWWIWPCSMTGDSYEDMLVSLLVCEGSSTVPLKTQ